MLRIDQRPAPLWWLWPLAYLLAGCGGAPARPDHAAPVARPTAQRSAAAERPTPRLPATALRASPTPDAALRLRADLAAGRALLQAQCAACHALASAGIATQAQPAGPALDHVGARRDRAWLERVLIEPCAAAKKRCGMPSYAGLTILQRDQLVRYLLAQR